MMNSEAIARIVRAYFETYPSRNRTALEALVADELRFTSPRDNRIDRLTYFDHCWPNSEDMRAIDITHLVVAGDRAFVTYEAEMVNARRFRNAEVLTVRDGQVVDVEVYFGWTLPHAAQDGTFVADSKG